MTNGRKAAIGLCGVLAIGLMPAAWAAEGLSYMEGSTRKLGRGIANAVTCPAELIRTPELVSRRDGYVAGLTVGIVQGAWHMIARGATGLYDVVTFPVAIPQNFEPVIYPEFIWRHGSWSE